MGDEPTTTTTPPARRGPVADTVNQLDDGLLDAGLQVLPFLYLLLYVYDLPTVAMHASEIKVAIIAEIDLIVLVALRMVRTVLTGNKLAKCRDRSVACIDRSCVHVRLGARLRVSCRPPGRWRCSAIDLSDS